MVDTDRNTGKGIEPEENIPQSIGMILTTPIGGLRQRHDFGFEVLDEDADPKAGMNTDRVEFLVRKALARWEPRIEVDDVVLDYDGDQLVRIKVEYRDKAAGTLHATTVRYG